MTSIHDVSVAKVVIMYYGPTCGWVLHALNDSGGMIHHTSLKGMKQSVLKSSYDSQRQASIIAQSAFPKAIVETKR